MLSPALDADVQLVDHLEHRVGDNLRIAIQLETLGTGDALRAAIPLLEDVDSVIVLFADHPLLTKVRMVELSESLRPAGAVVSVLTCIVDEAAGYGRIERDASGSNRTHCRAQGR